MEMNNLYRVNVTLEKFGEVQFAQLQDLLDKYKNANKGNICALPESWDDTGVFIDYNPNHNFVYLSNNSNQKLIATDKGCELWLDVGIYAGTLEEMAGIFCDDFETGSIRLCWDEYDIEVLYQEIKDYVEIIDCDDDNPIMQAKALIEEKFLKKD